MGLLRNYSLLSLLLTSAIAISVAGPAAAATWRSGERKTRFLKGIYPRVYVDIWNRLPQGVELSSHCLSDDDDMGEVGAGTDVAISFDFQPNVEGSTLFHCGLQAPGKYGELKFDVYDFDRDYNIRCKTKCTWNVREDGVHGVNQATQAEDTFYAWGHK